MDTKEETEGATESCAWCGEKCCLSCSSCHEVFYCNRQHQKKHWEKHKDACRPWIQKEDRDTGRYLVASRDLAAGALVLKEKALVLGPQARSSLVCIECHTPLDPERFHRCGLCHWPMCATICPSSKRHAQECLILRRDEKRCGVPTGEGDTPRYDLVLILRCLLLQFRNPSAWTKILNMESHAKRRKEDREPHHVAAVRYLKEVCLVENDVDEIHHVRGAIITNSINLKASSGISLRGLFSMVSLLNHSCTPNLTLRTNKNLNIFIHTTTPVKKGQLLSFSYVSPPNPVWIRGLELCHIYYFTCKCQRCEDPTEFGTFMSSPKCRSCPDTFLLHDGNYNSKWKCNNCGIQRELNELLNDVEASRKELLEDIPDDAISLKKFLARISQNFHSKHFLYLEAAQAVLRKIRQLTTKEMLQLKVELWEHILSVFDILEPGLTRRRGATLVEFAKSLLDLAMAYEANEIEAKKRVLNQASSVAVESLQILKLEPADSTEELWEPFTRQLQEKIKKETDLL